MGVTDAGWLFNGAGDIVVGVAQLVGQTLNLIRALPDVIEENRESGWSAHSLFSRHRHQVELVDVLVGDHRVNDSASQRVFEVADSTVKDASVHTLASVDVHHLAGIQSAETGQSTTDLLDLWDADTLHLTFSNTISVENQSGRVGSIHPLEVLQSIQHAALQSGASFLANLVLGDARRPIGGGSLVHTRRQRQDRLLTKGGAVEDIHAADHCRLTHEGKRVNSPGDAADLRIHLDEHLRDDTAQILAFLDGTDKHNLRGYWELLK